MFSLGTVAGIFHLAEHLCLPQSLDSQYHPMGLEICNCKKTLLEHFFLNQSLKIIISTNHIVLWKHSLKPKNMRSLEVVGCWLVVGLALIPEKKTKFD